ncbi:potassium/proton antiporter [Nocardioides marmoriginsengisoli]|uniref:Potassium/proton antiporter n=1 Tax=Nocardioides marmoriginsengisoli TaxID=661483 RepID=A0A3N0CFA3_9ACTN|nr:potassium/proton antiporter [Nocardioides marmoriginsengisoli]RNL62125.1 potassium/proton antiporter [Nocardioides marmoriginsengisoli]
MTLDVQTLNQGLLAGTGVLLVAIMAVRASVGAGLPSLLLYLLIGVGLGEKGLGINFSDAELANALGFAALIVILAEGGLTTNWGEMRPVARMGLSLATLGVAVSVGIVAVVAHFALGMSWQLAVLLGALTSPTDAAAVFSVLRRVPLPRRISATLEAESGLNDAPTVVLVTLVSASGHHGAFGFVGEVVLELVIGVVGGLLVGFGGAWLMRRAALPSSGLYPLAVLSFSVLAYAATATVHGSGFAAVYVAALVLGNSDLPHRAATRSFAEGMAWLSQIGLFVMLGLLVSPSGFTWEVAGIAVVAVVVLTVVARPVSVLVSSVAQPMPLRELGFISWAGLRGAVPIVLATIPLSAGVVDATELFNIVFVLVVIDTLITAPTLPFVARVLKVASRSEPRDLEVEAAPLERIAADLLMVTISPKSLMHGVEVAELRLPKGSSVSLIVRDGTTLVPQLRTVLRRGDELLVVTPRKSREQTEQRLRAVSLGGRLAQWNAEDR